MARVVLLGLGAAAFLLGAVDLGARWVLGGDLVRLAGAPAAVGLARQAPASRQPSRVTTLSSARYTILAVAAADCARGPECDVTLTIEPAPGLELSRYAPLTFVPQATPGVTYDGRPGRIQASVRTSARAVVMLPARVAAREGAALTGSLRVVTCDGETCKVEQQAIAIAVPGRS